MKYFLDPSKLSKDAIIRNVMALSGGGAKATFELQILNAIEKEAQSTLNVKYLADTMSLIAGTSAGAIISALIATKKFTIEEILTFWDKVLQKIFTKQSKIWRPLPIYDKTVFKSEWNNIFGSSTMKFGDLKCDTIITTFDVVSNTTCHYKSWKDEFKDDLITDVVIKSFSAPVYFGSTIDEKRQEVLYDGGCGSENCPIEAVKNEAEINGWYKDDNYLLMHVIGCLFSGDADTFAHFKDEANNKNIKQLFNFMSPASGGLARKSSTADQISALNFIAKNIQTLNYKYYDSHVDSKIDKMDAVDKATQMKYTQLGKLSAFNPLMEVIH